MTRSFAFAISATFALIGAAADRPNILLVTADDLNCDSVGSFGGTVAGATPRIDALAEAGMRFERAHVNIAVCQPCRNTLMTGRYPHRCGGEGFFHLRTPDLPTLPALLRDAGYSVGVLSKVPHSTPYADFRWDFVRDQGQLRRDPAAYSEAARRFVAAAKAEGKPFFLMANSDDPHRPFGPPRGPDGRRPPPSKVFAESEVVVPGFLPDLPDVRTEIKQYFDCVRRCDDMLGALSDELDRGGLTDETVVIFLSDHGMALPFAKTNCYLHSTRTPLIVRWPGVTKPGSADADHFVSTVDLMPTLLDAAGVTRPAGMDGRSLRPLLGGGTQDGRDRVFTQFHETSGRGRFPMRCVNDQRFGYIWNGWSDGETVFRNESQAGLTMKAMRRAAESDGAIAERVRLFLYRVPEELYDYRTDPDALRNLADDPDYREERDRLRAELAAWMVRTDDPLAGRFQTFRDDDGH